MRIQAVLPDGPLGAGLLLAGLAAAEAPARSGEQKLDGGPEAIDAEGALGGLEDAHEQAEEGSLAGAVGAEQAADLAGGDREGDVVKGGLAAEGLGDRVDADQAVGDWRRRWWCGSQGKRVRVAHGVVRFGGGVDADEDTTELAMRRERVAGRVRGKDRATGEILRKAATEDSGVRPG
jgi:hypothetical protein